MSKIYCSLDIASYILTLCFPRYEEMGFGDQAKALFDTVPKSFVTFYQMQTLDQTLSTYDR